MTDPVTPEQIAELRRLAALASEDQDELDAPYDIRVGSVYFREHEAQHVTLAANLAEPLAAALEAALKEAAEWQESCEAAQDCLGQTSIREMAVTRERDEARALCGLSADMLGHVDACRGWIATTRSYADGIGTYVTNEMHPGACDCLVSRLRAAAGEAT